ncbi:uncharacterized protein C8Q71DRAFT_888103 [Rhodofomes roseus]|uniref:Uncharacterized protein n=1 Tax=Rhodofomes roseus TaxID=34475 RepID=A0ABQ8K053_9APHY|nr:uncharacterized protein C8Q71DRAFT_888103 [Rhodofomes roseus]KAH9829715.1 hypothetical protein C8Q71DRAFT_888103 [Rhodofomes roseus]
MEPSVRTIYLPRNEWYELQEHLASCHQIRRGIIKLFYNLSQQHLTMSVTTPLHTEAGGHLEEGINVVGYLSEQLRYTKIKAESSGAAPYCVTSEGKVLQQVADHKLSVVLRQEFRRLQGQRRLTRGAEVQPPPFSCELTNVETSHSKHNGHVLHKATVRSSLMTKFAPTEVEGVVLLPAPALAATSSSTLASPAGAQALAQSPSLRPPATSSSTLTSLAGAQAQGCPRRWSTKPAQAPAQSPSPSPVRQSIKPEGEEIEIFGIVPVIIINLQDGSMAKGGGKPVGCKMVTFTSADGILELEMAPLKDADSFFGQLWQGDTLLTPERSAAMLVFPDREGLERLRKGVEAGWSAERFIEEGDGMHIVPDVPEAPGDGTQQSPTVRQEYLRMIPVWEQYVRQLRYMQCAYEKLAINVMHGTKSDEATAWLKDILPRLKAQEAQLPEGVAKEDDFGLAYVVDLIAEGLAQAAEKMAVEKHQSSFSAQNSYPKVLLAASMKRTHGDPCWIDINEGHLDDGYQYLLEGTLTKKLQYQSPPTSAYLFTD